jgi:hypothetical protein
LTPDCGFLRRCFNRFQSVQQFSNCFNALRANPFCRKNCAPRVPLLRLHASADSREKSMKDFAAAWTKVMHLDRFDLA